MENEKVVVLQLKLTRNRCLFALTLAFICLHARPAGSETLTLTTYYPAPYGGYVALLTTGTGGVNTRLARDGGAVGIGAAAPTRKLSVDGDFGSNGASIETLGSTWGGWNEAIRFPNASHAAITYPAGGMLFGMHSNRNFYWADTTNSPVVGGRYTMMLDSNGNLTLLTGGLYGACTRLNYDTAATDTVCPSGTSVFSHWGDGSQRLAGFLFKDNNAATLAAGLGTFMSLGYDWGGQMVCCKINVP